MPCDQVRRVQVQFGTNTNAKALQLALQQLGYTAFLYEDKSLQISTIQYSKDNVYGSWDSRSGNFNHVDRRNEFDLNAVSDEYQKQQTIQNLDAAGWEWTWTDESRTEMDVTRSQF